MAATIKKPSNPSTIIDVANAVVGDFYIVPEDATLVQYVTTNSTNYFVDVSDGLEKTVSGTKLYTVSATIVVNYT